MGVPAFVSRAFRDNSIYVRRDRIKSPADLKGKRVGPPEYQLTACVWARIILEDDHGMKPSDVIWVRGGIEHSRRPEKITIKLPPNVPHGKCPRRCDHFRALGTRRIDAFVAPRVPSLAGRNNPNIGSLFSDPIAAGARLLQAHRFFPNYACHRHPPPLVERHPGLPAAVLKAFQESKARASKRSKTPPRLEVTLPFVEEQLRAARDLMGG